MLDASDADLARRDPAIPGLATVLDQPALFAMLSAANPAFRVRQASPFYVHYKPRQRCMTAFRIVQQGSDVEHLAYADAYGPDAAVKLPKVRKLARQSASEPGQNAIVLDSLGIALYRFPTDRRLKALRHLADPVSRADLVRRLFGENAEPADSHWQHLRYKPERRYVAGLQSFGQNKAVIKFYNAQGYALASAGADAFASREALQIVPVAGRLADKRALGFEWRAGTTVDEILRENDATANRLSQTLELAGTALAELHGQRPEQLQRRTAEVERRTLEAQAVTLALLCPRAEGLATTLVGRMLSGLGELPRRVSGLHGDFNAEQVLIGTEQQAAFLDFDRAVVGNPAIDLGNFIAHLERDGQRGGLSSTQIAQYADAITRGYARVCAVPSAKAIRVYTAIGLFYLAAEPFRYREPDWPERIARLLDRVAAILLD